MVKQNKQNLNIRPGKKYDGLIEKLEQLATMADVSVNKFVLKTLNQYVERFKHKLK